MTATVDLTGKREVYKEVFVSPSVDSKADALYVLEEIRKAHPQERNWFELEAHVEKLSNGKWIAVREHCKYR